MEFNEQLLEVIRKIYNSKKYISTDEILKQTKIDLITLNNVIYLIKLNASSYGFKLLMDKQKCYKIEVIDQARFRLLNLDMQYFNNESRIDFIISKLIKEDAFIRIEDLADEMFVSRATIDRLMEPLKKELDNYSLKIISKPKYGICIVGNEKDKRICYAHHMDRNLNQDIIIVIQKILLDITKSYNIQLSDINFTNLVYHCTTAIKRVINHNYLDEKMPYELDEKYVNERAAAMEIVSQFEKMFDIHFPENEIEYIIIHLLSKREFYNQNIVNQDIWDCVEEIILNIKENKKIDLSRDFDLKKMLALHMQPMLLRLKYNLNNENQLVQQIKGELNNGFELALCAKEVIMKRYQLILNDEETGFLALYFALSLEKQAERKEHKKVAVICASGRGTAQIIKYKLMKNYQFKEEDIFLASIFQIDELNEDQFSCIFSTIPILEKTKLPIVLIDLTLSENSSVKISNFIKYSDMMNDNQNDMFEVIDNRLIFSNMHFQTKEEVLKFMSDKIYEIYQYDLYDVLIKREELASTEINGLLALPHPYAYFNDELIISFMTLDQEIIWKKTKIKLIILMAVPTKNSVQNDFFTKMITEMCTDSNTVEQITNYLDRNTLINLMVERSDFDL